MEPDKPASGRYLVTLSLGAMGVVYGDIGTSPLYAMKECFAGTHPVPPTPANVTGIVSLIFWSLVVVISIKYIVFVLRADNRGEGGILSLMSLVRPANSRSHVALMAMGLFGAALLYGDGMITPAISVLSAIEGLEIAAPSLALLVVPATILVLIVLFAIQRKGTAKVGAVFGPVMLAWFVAIAGFGIPHILREPRILKAVNPWNAVTFFRANGVHGFLVLGAVFLCVTGGEALYADMGHFGRRPIRLVWIAVVFPSLLLNYFGQGAMLLRSPQAAGSPFFNALPKWALYPMVGLATVATVIASQAIISGAFSLTRQASQLGFTPRVRILHTSAREIGQIYIPSVNWMLMVAAIGLVIGFRSSTALAAAYGVAVTATMGVTTILLYVVARERWHWKILPALALTTAFLTVDLSFFGANIIKIEDGGWFPLLVGAMVYIVMTTWRRGREILNERLAKDALPLDLFLKSVASSPQTRVRGTAVFMFRSVEGTPPALLHNIKHNKVLHERVVLLTVSAVEVPLVAEPERVEASDLGLGFFRIIIRTGYMEVPNVPNVLAGVKVPGLEFPPGDTSYFLSRETLFATSRPGMAVWRERLFGWLARNATSAVLFFGIPPNRVVELGSQIEL